jgi:hypothetical protein
MRQSIKDMSMRMLNGQNNFIETVQQIASCNQEQAMKVFKVYRNCKVLKYSAGIGRYSVIHGGFLEKDTIQRAIES